MSTTIDNKVVKMTFDNKSFEKGVDDTLKTIDKLNKSLEFKDASKGFDNIEQSADSVNFKKLEENIQTLSDRFSGLGIIGMQIWSNIGDSIWNLVTGPFKKLAGAIDSIENQIKTGGWNRALNLDKASNMLKNLGQGWDSINKTADTVEVTIDGVTKIVENRYKAIDKAVSGTAYSLDEAAVASANFLAVNQKMSNAELTDTLRAAMGIASTYSKDFSQIANYLQKVQSAGYLTKGIVSDMTMVGIAVEPILKEYLHLENASSEQMEKIYKNGLISFDQFRDALVWKFGDSLDKANETYEGSISNMKSAMSRTGALFAEPLLSSLIEGANEVRVLFNMINGAISSSGDEVRNIMNVVPTALRTIIDYVDVLFYDIDEKGNRVLSQFGQKFQTALSNIFGGLGYAGHAIAMILDDIAWAFKEVFFNGDFDNVVKKTGNFRDRMKDFMHSVIVNQDKIVDAFKGFFYAIKPIVLLLGQLLKIGFKVLGLGLKISVFILGLIGRLITLIVESKVFKTIITNIHKILDKVANAITKAKNKIIEFIKSLNLGTKALEGAKKVFDFLSEVLKIVWDRATKAFDAIINGIKEFNDKYHPFETALDAIKNGFEYVYEAVKKAIEKIAEFVGSKIELPTLEDIKEKLNDFKEKVVWAFQNPKEAADLLLDSLKKVADYVKTGFKEAVDVIVDKTQKFTDWLGGFKKGFDDSKKSMEEFADSDAMDKAEKKLSVTERIGNAMDKTAGAFERIWETTKGIGKKIVEGLQWIVDAISEFTDIHSLQDLIKVLGQLIGLAVKYNWSQAGAGIGVFLGTISQSIRTGLGTNVSLLKTLPEAILKIAEALAILAAVVVVIGSMNKDAVEQAKDMIWQLAALATMMVLAVKYLGMYRKYSSAAIEVIGEKNTTKISGPFANRLINFISGQFGSSMQLAAASLLIKSIGTAVLELVIAMAVLAKALKNSEGEIEWDTVKNMLKMLAGMLVMVAALMYVVIKASGKMSSKTDNTVTTTYTKKKSILFGLLQKIFGKKSVEVKDIFEIEKVGGSAGQIAAVALLILATGAAMLGLALALSMVSLVSSDKLSNGFRAFIGLFSLIIVFMYIIMSLTKTTKSNDDGSLQALAKGGQFAGLAAFLVALAAAMLLMTPTLIILGNIPLDKLAKGIGALSIMGIAMSIAAWLAGKAEHGFKALMSIIGVAISIKLIASALKDISEGYSDDANGMGAAIGVLVTMAILMGIVIFIASKVKSALETAGVIISFGASMYLCALAFAKIQDACDGTGDGLAVFVIMIVLMVLVIAGLGALVGHFPVLEKAMLAVSGAMLMLGAGIFLVAAALQMLWPLIDDISENKDTFAQALCDFAEIAAMALLRFFTYFLDSLAAESINLINSIGTLLLNLIVGIINFLAANATTIGVAIGHLVAAIIVIIVTAIVTLLVDLGVVIIDWIGDTFGGIAKKIKKVFTKIVDALWACLMGLLIVIGDFWVELAKFVLSFIGRVKELLYKLIVKPFKEIIGVIADLWNGDISIEEAILKVVSAVKDAVDSIKEFCLGVGEDIVKAFVTPFDKASDAVADFMATVNGVKETDFMANDTKGREAEIAATAALKRSDDYKKALKDFQNEMDKANAMFNKKKTFTVTASKDIYDTKGKYLRTETWDETKEMSEIQYLYNRRKSGQSLTTGQQQLLKQYEQYLANARSYAKLIENYGDQVLDQYRALNEDIADDITNLYTESHGKVGMNLSGMSYLMGEDLGKSVIEGWRSMLNYSDDMVDWLMTFNRSSAEVLEVNSPSKLFKRYGEYVVEGFNVGMEDTFPITSKIFATAIGGIEEIAENASITPVFDLSEIQNESEKAASAMMDMKTNIPQEVDLLNNTNASKIDYLGESVDGLSNNLSTATLEQIITTQNGLIQALSNKLNDMGVYIDGKTLVGSVITDIDKGLGARIGQIGRSVAR